jgi:hypothetical protein
MPPTAPPHIEILTKKTGCPPSSQPDHRGKKSPATGYIKKADKGSCIVVEDTSNYIKDGLQHLGNNDIYERTTLQTYANHSITSSQRHSKRASSPRIWQLSSPTRS